MDPLRILYVPNEAGSFRQLGFRRPFANLRGANLIDDVSVFSLQWRIQNGGDPEGHRQDLIARVGAFRPNVVLMQHLGSTGLKDRHFEAMRAASDFELVYHEADPYSRFLHPLPVAARAAGRAANVVFTVGTGTFAENFRRTGSTDVRWASHVFEAERFRRSPVSQVPSREHDVVIVANRNTPRFRGHPNWKDRIRFVSYLQERFGDRLAIYGNGWTGVGAMGPISFSSQSDAIRSAWVSANWDHYAAEPSYFSNRLPISLSVGSIHATTSHKLYENIFPEFTKRFLIFGQTHEHLADSIERVLAETTPAERILAGESAQDFAYEHYRQDNQLVEFLNYRARRVSPEAAAAAWDIDATPLEEL
ncbi:hypothetical protein [Cryobacterium tagatosivorans]|uniref:Glycosyltransferase family 1 protein n=1 Tax=Cryobacterium tagatosivorans TaxID=1259199 RepID=A0A4R8UD23_9MICO|nr:hypothetical protein [Cryobacterium tagatosivorans]TFB47791.1 hypothetical protein E3O23_14375 [Cryobacterium tagatosivorans]